MASKKKKQTGRITLASTGLVVGETAIVPTQPGWCGSRLTCEEGVVPPALSDYKAWPADDHDTFFVRLYEAVCHRDNMVSVDVVRAWFLGAACDVLDAQPYAYMTQAPGVKVCVERLAGSLPDEPGTISEANAQQLVGTTMTPLEALEMFEETGAGNEDPHRRRLIFMLDYWQLETTEMPASMPPDAFVLVLSAAGVRRSSVATHSIDERRRFVRLPSATKRLYVLPESAPPDTRHCQSAGERAAFVEQVLDSMEPVDSSSVATAVDGLALGVLKSLLQKIVRTGAQRVQLEGVTLADGSQAPDVDAAVVLAAVVARMLTRSMFNPHGGGLETGLAAVFKRGAICSLEDAWPTGEGAAGVEWMMVCAAVALNRRRWAPPHEYLVRAARLLDACRRSRTVCVFDGARAKSLPLLDTLPDNDSLGTVRFLFDHFVGGMTGDQRMVRDIHSQSLLPAGLPLAVAPTDARVAVMPIYHCLDQHCATALPYLFTPGQEAAREVTGSRDSCAALFRRLFNECTGLNPRRAGAPASATALVDLRARVGTFFSEVQTAQQRLWRSMLAGSPVHSVSASTVDCKLLQPYDRLAQAVGVQKIEYKHRTRCWTLDPMEAAQINVATKQSVARVKPVSSSGDDDDSVVSSPVGGKRSASSSSPAPKRSAVADGSAEEAEEEMEGVRAAVRKRLIKKGIRVPALGNALVKLGPDAGGMEVVTVDGVDWEKAREYVLKVPAMSWNAEAGPTDSLVAPRDSLDLDRCVAKFKQLLAAVTHISHGGVQLAISMMRSPARVLTFPRPDRDGGPSRDAGGQSATRLHFEAWAVCKMFADWSALLLCPRSGNNLSQFETPAAYLDLRLRLAQKLSSSDWSTIKPEACDRAVDAAIAWYEGARGHRAHAWQKRALRMLGYRVVDGGHRAHFLWMEMGSGKTDTALMFAALLRVLCAERSSALRALFITTRSALNTVYTNTSGMGLFREVITRAADVKNFLARNGGGNNVVFIPHDVIKSPDVMAELLPLFSSSLVVIDEVHECTGVGTKRCTATQMIANISKQVLFMTATPLRSSREKATLRGLMQHVANFPVKNDDDFLVASGAMVHPLVYDRVESEELLHSAQSDANTERLMRHLPRRLGGGSDAARMDHAALVAALDDAYTETDECVARYARAEVECGNRPFVVCRDYGHCQRMATLLRVSHGFSVDQLWVAEQGKPIKSLEADASVVRRQLVAVVPIRQHSGYSATHFNVRLRGVFPSNQAHRDQIDGRIVRSGQPVSPVRLVTIHCGITSLIVNKHLDASSTVKLMDQLNGIKIQQ